MGKKKEIKEEVVSEIKSHSYIDKKIAKLKKLIKILESKKK
tara:strand:- start:350 stop:472 length:123 start_codon:yes stop_codon:yes gene_type:complete